MEKIPAITVFDQNILSEYFIYLASKELNNTQRYYHINYLKTLEMETNIKFDDMTKNVLLIYQFVLKRIYPEKYREILEFMIKYLENRKNNWNDYV